MEKIFNTYNFFIIRYKGTKINFIEIVKFRISINCNLNAGLSDSLYIAFEVFWIFVV